MEKSIAAEIRALPAWRRSVLEHTELEYVGLQGAFKAAQTFDPARGRFTTYASDVEGAAQRELLKMGP